MRIGIDFDNTIVSYDRLFHKVAAEQEVIPRDLAATKLAVRDYLRRIDKEDVWTEMQGYVYGSRMGEAEAYPDAVDFLIWARDSGIETFIISHKTEYPFRGPRHDLHAAARGWVHDSLKAAGRALVPPERVFFETTKDAKLDRVRQTKCNVFIDDLPEILLAPAFPENVDRILFDPDAHHRRGRDGLFTLGSWSDIRAHLETRCLTIR